ncbi:MAG: apolipoprotein N-acyltransferase [Gammaproteobacteria bacterium]|nr:apolipoprotein N-acyltransferase [Gammaproteobacteria bacterium]
MSTLLQRTARPVAALLGAHSRVHGRTGPAAAAAAGALLPLAFAPFGWFWVAPVSYALLFLLWRAAPPRRAFMLGFWYGIASFFAGIYWVYISIHDFGQVHPALALLLTVSLVALLALFPAVTGWIASRWLGTSGGAAWLGLLPALWVLTEWVRGWIFTGFGWLSAGYSQTDSWLMGFAPVAGIHGMGWAVLLSAGALAALAAGTRDERKGAVVALVVLWGAGFVLDDRRWTEPKPDVLTVSLLQGSMTPDLKWRPEQLEPTLGLYRDLTMRSAGKQLIVWPEAAIPDLYENVSGYLSDLEAWADREDSAILLGVLRGTIYDFDNTLVALTSPRQFYVKRHLVPFGEYFPVPGFVREWLRLMSLPYVDAEPGPPEQPPLDVAGERVAVTICYENVFGAEQLHYLPESTLLVNVSNDAWFGDSIAPHQHLQIARVRAAEAGRYMLRATNNGITAIIDPLGNIVDTIPQFEVGVLDGAVQGYTGATPYARVGNWLAIAGAFAVIALLLALRWRRGAARQAGGAAVSDAERS